MLPPEEFMTDFIAHITKVQTLSTDGTIRLWVDFPTPPEDAVEYGAMMATLRQGQSIKLVPLSDAEHRPQDECTCIWPLNRRMYDESCPVHDAEVRPDELEPVDYGQQAKELRLSGFCRSPDVWEALGIGTWAKGLLQSDKDSIGAVEDGAWAGLRTELAVDSMKHCPPEKVRSWATEHGVERYLPESYR